MRRSEKEKRIRKATREAVGLAYERELSAALTDLEAYFRAWREGELNAFELDQKIHQHHDGIARDLWKRYDFKPEELLPIVVAEGTIQESELPAEVVEEYRDRIDAMRRLRTEVPNEPDESAGPAG